MVFQSEKLFNNLSKDVEKLFEGKDIDDIFTKAIKREY